jgi:glyoxylase-like metal-dependent hydrolase (beta-lactamase superfamily II)/rhodanese-related sulfurtransferase
MKLEQFYLGCLAHASYLIGDEETRTAVVVDPQRDVTRYVEAAQRDGLMIRHVILTHLHADFIAGHLELRDRFGAQIYLGAKAQAEYAFTPLADGDVLTFGNVRLQAMETPGHTPESLSILVFDLAKHGHEPIAVLTGDTLFIGDVGRPDLRAALGWKPDVLARMLFRSLTTKLLGLPDATLVYPAHGAGSLCGRNIAKEAVSTIGVQRRTNYALQPMGEDEFVEMITADQPEAPAYFTYAAVLNAKERPTLEESLQRALTPLELDPVLEMLKGGAQVIDVREPDEFAAGHLQGSVNIGLNGQYATWAGTLLKRDTPIVLIANPGREEEAAMRLGRIGFDHVAGYLRGGMGALESRPELLRGTVRVDASTLANELSETNGVVLLDVRGPRERESKRIGGSMHLPLNHLEQRLAELPCEKKIVVHCAGGYRSSIAASLLERGGFLGVRELAGGLAAWEAAKLELEGATTKQSLEK